MGLSASETYARLLLPKKHGYPMFIPEPNDALPNDYKDVGFSIGDLGILTSDGAWDVLFNICFPIEHSINSRRVPPGFEPMSLGPDDVVRVVDAFPPGTDITSATAKPKAVVTGPVDETFNNAMSISSNFATRFDFTEPSTGAAILSLPSGAANEDLRDVQKFRAEALHKAKMWYEFANETCGRSAPNGSLYLITGCTKAATWKLGSYPATTVEEEVVREGDMVYTRRWEGSVSPMVRSSWKRDASQPTFQNQGVFIRGFKLSLRDDPIAEQTARRNKVVENVSDFYPDGQVPDEYEYYEEDVIIESIGVCSSESYHPAPAINDYLLEAIPDAPAVVTHDSDWIAVIEDQDAVLPSDAEMVQRIQDKYTPVSEAAGGYLTPKSTEAQI